MNCVDKDTLPNEWVASWNPEALKAGAVIIRSGPYWRIRRSDLGSVFPNNNCHQGVYCFTVMGSPVCLFYYNDAPNSQGGHENFLPDSHWHHPGAPNTNPAVDATFQYHAERVNIPAGRPDALVPLRYNDVIQIRTNQTTGTWVDRIRYAYIGAGPLGDPYNPNHDCSQLDSWSPTDPAFPNN